MYHVPDRFRWVPADQSSFINQTKQMAKCLVEKYEVRSRFGGRAWTDERLDEARYHRLIECRYREGRISGALKISFDDFLRACHPIRYYHYRPSRYRYDYSQCPYRNGNSYRRNVDHAPKDHEPTPKETWRQIKRFARDKSKHRGWRLKPKSGIAYWKTKSAREHRRWVNEQIYRESWESLHDREYREFVDPWDYD